MVFSTFTCDSRNHGNNTSDGSQRHRRRGFVPLRGSRIVGVPCVICSSFLIISTLFVRSAALL